MECEICTSTIENPKHIEGHVVCEDCYTRAASYVSRVEARLDRLQERARKSAGQAHSTINRAREMADTIPFGQPILGGHHSEGGDRRYRDRIHKTFRRGFDQLKKAQHQQARAEAAEKNRAISSDDPAAVLKLRDKLAELETKHALRKDINKRVRQLVKGKLTPEQQAEALVNEFNLSPTIAVRLLTPERGDRVGFQAWELTNVSTEIRRVKKRIEELQQQAIIAATSAPTREEHDDIILERDFEENRLRLYFPGKPDENVRAFLRQHGFKWSRYNGAWQRQLSTSAEYWAKEAIKLTQSNSDT